MSSAQQYEKIAEQLYSKHFQVPDTKDFRILSTIRYDPKLSKVPPTIADDISIDNFFLLPEHVLRLQYTIDFFNIHGEKTLDFQLNAIFKKLKETIVSSKVPVDEPLKIRFLVSTEGDATIELHKTPPVNNLLAALVDSDPENMWDVYVDAKSIVASPFTSFKTTHRPHYTQARSRCLPGKKVGKEEVLLINEKGLLMEGSITNVAVQRDGQWVTPTLTSGCLCGVTRHFLLMKGYVVEQEIKAEDIKEGEEILLFNGIMGVVRAKVAAFV